ncbi:glutathione S-transferase family protein [Qipengyuania soli]|uniref:Glutathione S-transferase n=1 Tax=Qipengyuania soli TaxID=2782568 RepID=A0A7S8F574_9SPHN|nr:glutathione S-transferase [Qipengyuania soli]QPC99434.1 glutathione S-transferase [Qipengyuania soli]
MPDIILHHYDASPFSNKVRLLLGLKGLAWKSVVTPNMMPKPDLVPLTGGYRRAPVMQIGADIYCDSQVIMAEIERRFPEPKADFGAGWPINLWADRQWFQHSVAIIFGLLGDKVDPAFIADREKLSGRPFDVKAMAAFAGPARGQWRAQAGWIERALGTGGEDFLFGSLPAIGDLAAHMNIWFLKSAFPDLADELLDGFDRVKSWYPRIEALGQGSRAEIAGVEALHIASEADPAVAPFVHDTAATGGLQVGSDVVVAADDYGRDPISGKLVSASVDRIVISRSDSDLGTCNLHFPRVGFVVTGTGAG